MMHIEVSKEILLHCPDFVGIMVCGTITNTAYNPSLWDEIRMESENLRKQYTPDSLKTMSSVQATRMIYKALGKDPSRYRPSGEALVRRILQGKDLYQINTAVDLINLASMVYGYSIGGFDTDKIDGKQLILGVGQDGEPYEGIGRGPLNIAGLPVYRDHTGGIGTPTSDNERTKLSEDTQHLTAIINGYDGQKEQVEACATMIQNLMKKYLNSHDSQIIIFKE